MVGKWRAVTTHGGRAVAFEVERPVTAVGTQQRAATLPKVAPDAVGAVNRP
jgi:hypothetical protein